MYYQPSSGFYVSHYKITPKEIRSSLKHTFICVLQFIYFQNSLYSKVVFYFQGLTIKDKLKKKNKKKTEVQWNKYYILRAFGLHEMAISKVKKKKKKMYASVGDINEDLSLEFCASENDICKVVPAVEEFFKHLGEWCYSDVTKPSNIIYVSGTLGPLVIKSDLFSAISSSAPHFAI